MKKIIFFLIVFLFPIKVLGITTSATSAIVMDMDSGRILYEKNSYDQMLIASTTKIMTAVLAIENGNLDDEVKAGEEILKMYGTSIYLSLDEVMSLRDLLYGLLLRSGNDAAVVIAKHIAGSEKKFVEMMNDKAEEIGMSNTIFRNPHGLDEETQNYSTAYDMALLSSYAMSLKDYRTITKTTKYITKTEDKSYIWYNRNKLLTRYDYATGGKNGYTPKAGRTLVTNAQKGEFKLTAVTLDDSNEYDSHIKMYDYAFDKYERYLLVDKNKFKTNDTYYGGKLYIKNSFYYPLTKEEKSKIDVAVKLVKKKNYKNNDTVGEVRVYLDGKELDRQSVFVRKINTPKSGFEKIKDFFKNLIK